MKHLRIEPKRVDMQIIEGESGLKLMIKNGCGDYNILLRGA